MKITDSKNVAQILDRSASRPAAKVSAETKPAAGEPMRLSAMSSELSALETQFSASPAFDSGKVEAIKQAIRDGQFTIDPGAIADKLLSSVRDFLNSPH